MVILSFSKSPSSILQTADSRLALSSATMKALFWKYGITQMGLFETKDQRREQGAWMSSAPLITVLDNAKQNVKNPNLPFI